MELTYHAQSRPDVFDWQATGGSLSVDADGVSGTVDASLAREGGKVPVQVKGSWRCGEVTPLAVDPALASTPCGPLYFVAQLSTDDIDRIKGEQGCLPQDLTLSGSVNGHVTEGVNDKGSAESIFTIGKQGCDYRTKDEFYLPNRSAEHYQGNFHFLVDDEVFTVHISQWPYAPGSYNAFTRYSIGGILQDPQSTLTLYDDRPADVLKEDPGRLTSWSSRAGMVSIAGDGVSGSVDMDLEGGVGGTDKVHLAGSWRCQA